jgi:multisubunit Na+/H+ antiporter MnhC subunit
LGKRSRKQRAPRPAPAAVAPKPPSRSELRNAEARAALEPLTPGERPRAVTIGAGLTFIAATVNIVLYAAGEKIQGTRPALAGILFFTALMYAMAWGLWKARYWAVLGLEGLIGILLVIFSLFALRAESLADVVISLGILIPAGALFWFLVKAMARIQMPERPR